MSIENQPGLLESWEKIQFEKGNELAVRTAQLLREQYGDEPIPQIIKPTPPPLLTLPETF